ncbi:hypothetical protein DHD80_07380 [Gramella sp. AN32]|nr:hypothetical protein [Gramella sp. AN32]
MTMGNRDHLWHTKEPTADGTIQWAQTNLHKARLCGRPVVVQLTEPNRKTMHAIPGPVGREKKIPIQSEQEH